MIESLARNAQPLLDQPYIRRVRRNHGLEHATVHMLSRRLASLSVAGRSDGRGFWIMGDVETAHVEAAVKEALQRMQKGEHQWAVHPNCGTSLVTTSTMMGLAALLGSAGVKRGMMDYLGRLPTVVLLGAVALIASRPVGLQLQEHFTTLGDPGDLKVLGITRKVMTGLRGKQVVLHRVETVSS